MTSSKSRANHIIDTVSDLVGSFLYDDRKEDEDLPRGEIEAAIKAGELTAENIVDWFRVELLKGLSPTPLATFADLTSALAAHSGACHVCHDSTQSCCSDCAINFGARVYVCGKRTCREEHDRKCFGDSP